MRMHNPAHPGAIITDTLGHVSRKQLSDGLGLTPEQVEELLRGERDVTTELAQKLAIIYPNQPADLWLRLQQQRDEWSFLLSQDDASKQ